jgi:hypothetical protein
MNYVRDKNIKSDMFNEGQLDRVKGFPLPSSNDVDPEYEEGWLDKHRMIGTPIAAKVRVQLVG